MTKEELHDAFAEGWVIESVELMIKQPGHADRTVRLPEGATRLGRAEDNEVVLSDVGVSRRIRLRLQPMPWGHRIKKDNCSHLLKGRAG